MTPAEETAAPVPHYPCPRCGKDRGAETRLLCSACWAEAPDLVRLRWVAALQQLQAQHPAAQALLKWANPEAPAPKRSSRHKKKPVPCGQCKQPVVEPSRRALATQLREILPQGTPVKVRERAELVARRLDGLCETCAAAPGVVKQ